MRLRLVAHEITARRSRDYVSLLSSRNPVIYSQAWECFAPSVGTFYSQCGNNVREQGHFFTFLLKNALFSKRFCKFAAQIIINDMNTAMNNRNSATAALEKAMEVRRVWMEALSGKVDKKVLDEKGIRFMAVTE